MNHLGKKEKLFDEVAETSKKMKVKYESKPDREHFGNSISVDRLIRTVRPTKESMIARKNIAFASLIDQ